MSLFPRYEEARSANVVKAAKVGATAQAPDIGPSVSNFRDFSGPAPHGFQPPECACEIAQRVADLVDAYVERMAICLEASDIGKAEAEITAALEVGRAFVRNFGHDHEGDRSDIQDVAGAKCRCCYRGQATPAGLRAQST